jgi:predicted deacetylase
LVRAVDYKVDEYLNLRLNEETKGLQVGYHQMGRRGEDKKIFEAPRWYPSPMSIKDRIVLGLDEQVLINTDAC